jgi:2-oxoglutarate ferredoxin oxidoreductase subunit beta
VFGLKTDWLSEPSPTYHTLQDYESGSTPRWCQGCGDLAILSTVQRLCRDEQLDPDKVVSVSGIGCSSRFPHYMGTYGFHGLHGRALPVACGVKSRRPDLKVFVAMGDGDCCSIGAGHWVHGLRYNMDLVVLLFDNNVYGLTKKQSSPTSPKGFQTNTHPDGAWLSPINPLAVSLSVTNASFVAQTIDWNPAHLYATIRAAYEHKGMSFVRVLQRCPKFSSNVFEVPQKDPSRVLLLSHEDGLEASDVLTRTFSNQLEHDPSDMPAARALAERGDVYPIGVLFRDETKDRYDQFTSRGMGTARAEKVKVTQDYIDRFLV